MYKELETVLRQEYGDKISIQKISPLHDEDFEPCYMVCVDDVICCRADERLIEICEMIESM